MARAMVKSQNPDPGMSRRNRSWSRVCAMVAISGLELGLGLGLGLGLLAGAGGCQSRPRATSVELPDRNLREAALLAQEAQQALAAKKYEKSVELSRRALSLNDGLWGAWNNLGVGLMMLQNNMDAAEAFKKAAELVPSDPRPYENLGNVYRETGNDRDAIRYYGESLQRDPTWLPSLRGGIVSVKNLKQSDETSLEWAKRGLMVERDKKWRDVFMVEKFRIERDLEEAKGTSRS